jgi:hypothetical protein
LSIDISPEQLEAAIARIEQEKERRIAERVEAGELVTVPLSVTVGTAAEIPAAVEQAEANKLAELRSAGETREVVFGGTICVTGVCRLAGGEEWKPAPRPPLPHVAQDEDKEEVREEPRPSIVESYVWVQTRPCRDDGNDPGEILEGWFSVDDGTVTVTDREGRYITSRAMIAGEAPAAVARLLLCEKGPEDFNRRLDYPRLGIA